MPLMFVRSALLGCQTIIVIDVSIVQKCDSVVELLGEIQCWYVIDHVHYTRLHILE